MGTREFSPVRQREGEGKNRGAEEVPRCQHGKVNGARCGSPALRRRRRCYFHEEVRIDREKTAADAFAQRTFRVPVLEDANAVQVALMRVIEMLGYGRMQPKVAGLILYALQTASYNLCNTQFEAEKAPGAAMDRDPNRRDANRRDPAGTRGQHWIMRDFADGLHERVGMQEPEKYEPMEEHEVIEKERDDEVAASSEEIAAVAAPEQAVTAKRANREKVRRTVEGLIRNYVTMETARANPG
jgi:hypothetical protein